MSEPFLRIGRVSIFVLSVPSWLWDFVTPYGLTRVWHLGWVGIYLRAKESKI